MEWLEIAGVLGGTAVLGPRGATGAGFVRAVEQGLPRRALTELKRFAGFSDAELAEVIPRRTLTNAKRMKTLTPDQSDRVARMAGAVALAQRVFGEPDVARAWLTTPNPSLDGESPLRLLRTGSGADLVESVLIRIEHGVYE